MLQHNHVGFSDNFPFVPSRVQFSVVELDSLNFMHFEVCLWFYAFLMHIKPPVKPLANFSNKTFFPSVLSLKKFLTIFNSREPRVENF